MREFPGIYIDCRGLEPRAKIVGTGVKVFLVYKLYVALERDFAETRASFDWLSEAQVHDAIDYAEAHEDEMKAMLEEDARGPERLRELWAKYPNLAPPGR